MELLDAPSPEALQRRREGFLVGAVVGSGLTGIAAGLGRMVAPPPGRRRAGTALADALLVELTGGGVDLRRLGARWIDWRRDDGLDADPILLLALDHLRDFDAPVGELPSGSIAAIAAVLPAALASASPRAMISGSFHVARMLDPTESTALAAMATVIAVSVFLEGRRLTSCPTSSRHCAARRGAPVELLDALRTIPRDPQHAPPLPAGVNPDPVAAVTWLLWQAHHRPRGADVLFDLAHSPGVSEIVGAVAGALFGARDGTESWPPDWLSAAGEEVALRRALAQRLAAS